MFFRLFDKDNAALLLSEGELQLRRQKQKRILIIAASILVLIVVGLLSARPVLHGVRAWQARRHAQKAFALIEQEQWTKARDEAIAAYQLRPNEPQAIRAVARLLSRAGQADALKFWKELEAKTKLTRADLRDEASVAVIARELDVADKAVTELLSNHEGGPTPADWLLAADLAVQEQDFDRATVHVRQIFASNAASDRDRFQATVILDRILRTKEAKDQSEALERFAGLARGKDSVALDALVVLGQHVLGSKGPWPDSTGMSVDDIIQALETHPLAKAQHKLLAIDLKIREHPDQRDALIEDAIAQWKGADNAALLALAGWLNSRGEYQRELDTIPRQRATQMRELFFQHVDALGALSRWDEIRRLIESEQFPLDPVVEHMYLARCFAQLGQTNGAENNWSRALEAAAGDLGKLMTLADYAEKNGAYDVAGAAYDAAVAVAPKSRPAQQGRLRVAYANRDTKKIYAVLTELLKLWPGDPAIQNDEAYIRLLLLPSLDNSQLSPSPLPAREASRPEGSAERAGGPAAAELAAIESLAEKLVEHEPVSFPHRTVLALARLKQNRPADALAVYSGINVPKAAVTTSSVAVHAAVLAANAHKQEAQTEFATLPPDRLLPEERTLVEKMMSDE
jgi:tetratricopeptide (TPR) repeat protein